MYFYDQKFITIVSEVYFHNSQYSDDSSRSWLFFAKFSYSFIFDSLKTLEATPKNFDNPLLDGDQIYNHGILNEEAETQFAKGRSSTVILQFVRFEKKFKTRKNKPSEV